MGVLLGWTFDLGSVLRAQEQMSVFISTIDPINWIRVLLENAARSHMLKPPARSGGTQCMVISQHGPFTHAKHILPRHDALDVDYPFRLELTQDVLSAGRCRHRTQPSHLAFLHGTQVRLEIQVSKFENYSWSIWGRHVHSNVAYRDAAIRIPKTLPRGLSEDE